MAEKHHDHEDEDDAAPTPRKPKPAVSPKPKPPPPVERPEPHSPVHAPEPPSSHDLAARLAVRQLADWSANRDPVGSRKALEDLLRETPLAMKAETHPALPGPEHLALATHFEAAKLPNDDGKEWPAEKLDALVRSGHELQTLHPNRDGVPCHLDYKAIWQVVGRDFLPLFAPPAH